MEQINFPLLLVAQLIFTVVVAGIATAFIVRRNKTFGQGREEASFETLHLANRTLPYLRQGLSRATADKTVELIYNYTKAAAVGITTGDSVLAFKGVGEDHHNQNDPANVQISKEVVKAGRPKVGHGKAEIGC